MPTGYTMLPSWCLLVLQVGRNGSVMGVDTKPVCVKLCQDNVRQLQEANSE